MEEAVGTAALDSVFSCGEGEGGRHCITSCALLFTNTGNLHGICSMVACCLTEVTVGSVLLCRVEVVTIASGRRILLFPSSKTAYCGQKKVRRWDTSISVCVPFGEQGIAGNRRKEDDQCGCIYVCLDFRFRCSNIFFPPLTLMQ